MLDGKSRADDVGLEGSQQGLARQLVDELVCVAAGDDDEYVEATVAAHHGAHEVLNLGLISDIAGDCLGADGGSDALRFLQAPGAEEDSGAFAYIVQSRGFADAAVGRSTDDQRDLVLKLSHPVAPLAASYGILFGCILHQVFGTLPSSTFQSEVATVSVVHLPVGPCLEALRDALKTVLGPESQSALARHYTHIAELVLSRWLAAEEILPSITRRYAEQARDQLETVRGLLRELDPQSAPPPEATLQELLRRLGEAMPRASGSQAARFQTLGRAVISTEAAVRNEWEAAIAAIAARPSRAPRSRLICAGDIPPPEASRSATSHAFRAAGPRTPCSSMSRVCPAYPRRSCCESTWGGTERASAPNIRSLWRCTGPGSRCRNRFGSKRGRYRW